MRFLGLGFALLIAGALTGCGSAVKSASSGSPAATVTRTVTGGGGGGSASATSGTAGTTTPTGSTTSATATSTGPQACRASRLGLSFLGQQGATGHGEVGFSLRNSGSEACVTVGYPGIQFLDRAGAALPTVPTHTTQDFFGHAPVVSLVVKPGQNVSFRLGVTHGASSSKGCSTAYGLRVIPPNDTATLTTQIPDGAYECITATVSPLRPGDSAYP